MSEEVPVDLEYSINCYGSEEGAFEMLAYFESTMFVHKAFLPLLNAIIENDMDNVYKESHKMVSSAWY